MSARPKSAKPSAFNHHYSIKPGPRHSGKFLTVNKRNVARNTGLLISNFNIKMKPFRGQQYAVIVVKGQKVGKGVQNRSPMNYTNIRNRIVRAVLGGNIPNLANIKNNANAFVLSSVLSKGVKHSGRGRNSGFASIMGNKNLSNRIFSMAHPGKPTTARTLINSKRRKNNAYRKYLRNVYWSPPKF